MIQIQAKSVVRIVETNHLRTQSKSTSPLGLPPLFARQVSFASASNMLKRTGEQKFWDSYNSYKVAKQKGDTHHIKVNALMSIGRLQELLGSAKYKDKNECAKVLNSAGVITHQQALEDYEELYRDAVKSPSKRHFLPWLKPVQILVMSQRFFGPWALSPT
jgi:hypothetical protein